MSRKESELTLLCSILKFTLEFYEESELKSYGVKMHSF